MTERNKQADSSAIELSEEDLGAVQGGYANLEVSHLKSKKAHAPSALRATGEDLTKSYQDGEDKF